MLGISGGPARLLGVALLESAAYPPRRRRADAGTVLSRVSRPHLAWQVLDAVVRLIQRIEEGGPWPEEAAAFQHLDLDAGLEHVAGGSHHDVGQICLGEQGLGLFGLAALDGRLIDRPRQDVGGSQRESGGHRGGRPQTARRSHADRAREAMVDGDSSRSRSSTGAGRQRPVVGVAAGMGLGGEVLARSGAVGRAPPRHGSAGRPRPGHRVWTRRRRHEVTRDLRPRTFANR